MMLVRGDVVMATTFDYVEGLLFELKFESVKACCRMMVKDGCFSNREE
jgi:hypothetical protein